MGTTARTLSGTNIKSPAKSRMSSRCKFAFKKLPLHTAAGKFKDEISPYNNAGG
jgi:hypothetical protein